MNTFFPKVNCFPNLKKKRMNLFFGLKKTLEFFNTPFNLI